jgi:hypothetical protein
MSHIVRVIELWNDLGFYRKKVVGLNIKSSDRIGSVLGECDGTYI